MTLRQLGMILLLASTCLSAQEWEQVRGDNIPNGTYRAFVKTPLGRWLAAGDDGALMYSDDQGTTWQYQVMRDLQNRTIRASVTDMVVHNGQIVATSVDYTSKPNRFGLPFTGRTRLLYSNDNGNRWRVEEFPLAEAISSNQRYPGIYLPNLFVTPGGQLLAYGSASVGTLKRSYFIGGGIFRETGGSWDQLFFGFGILDSMAAGDGGRLVASGFQSVLDSPDGLSWNGYTLREANLRVDGQALPFEARRGLYGADIAFLDNQYVMQVAQLKPAPNRPNLFTSKLEEVYSFTSPNPFDGGRLWEGQTQGRLYPEWLNTGSGVVSMSGSAFRSGDGISWSEVDDTVNVFTPSYGSVGAQTLIAVGNSRNVWRSDNNGQSWTQILEIPEVPSINAVFPVGDVLFGRTCNFVCENLWISYDFGRTWIESPSLNEIQDLAFSTIIDAGDQLIASGNFARSVDGGLTWELMDTPFNRSTILVEARDGRLVTAAGTGPFQYAAFFSDDGGDTWQQRETDFLVSGKDAVYGDGGRVLVIRNGFASFDPRLLISRDNGETWSEENPFQGVEGLNTVSGGDDVVIDLLNIHRLASGRLIILGRDGEILTSDNRGDSWTVRMNRDLDREPGEPNLDWTVYDVAESHGLVIVPARRDGVGDEPDSIYFTFVSEDDGTTWREVSVPNALNIQMAQALEDGRILMSGSNGQVFLADLAPTSNGEPELEAVRESESLSLEVPRPPLDGEITLNYVLRTDAAEADVDFVDDEGELVWTANDSSSKFVNVVTIDDDDVEEDETLLIDFTTQDDVSLSYSTVVTITDDDGGTVAGIEVIDGDRVETSEAGGSDTFRVALTTQPSSEVTISLALDSSAAAKRRLAKGDNAEVVASPLELTFTTQNWKDPQTVIVTGQDDNVWDRDTSTRILLSPQSADTSFDALLPVPLYIINVDDETNAILIDDFEAK